MLALGLVLALLGQVLMQAVQVYSLRRRLELVERHTDRRIDLAMTQIDDLQSYRDRVTFHHWN